MFCNISATNFIISQLFLSPQDRINTNIPCNRPSDKIVYRNIYKLLSLGIIRWWTDIRKIAQFDGELHNRFQQTGTQADILAVLEALRAKFAQCIHADTLEFMFNRLKAGRPQSLPCTIHFLNTLCKLKLLVHPCTQVVMGVCNNGYVLY